MVKIGFLDPLKNWEGNFLELFPFAQFVSGLGWLDSDSQKKSTPSPFLPTSITLNFGLKSYVKHHLNFRSLGWPLNLIQMDSFFQRLVFVPRGTTGGGKTLNFQHFRFFGKSYCTCFCILSILTPQTKYMIIMYYDDDDGFGLVWFWCWLWTENLEQGKI